MRHFISALLVLALLLLSGCAAASDGGTTAEPQLEYPTVSPAPASTQPSEPEETFLSDDRLCVRRVGRYSGLNPEGGSDESVENVVALLVENVSDQACQFCTIVYEINGETATFQLSELPAGKSAWVLESAGMTAQSDPTCVYQTCTAAFRDTSDAWLDGVTAVGANGELTVTNGSETDYPLVAVYYKLTYGTDVYLGGIAYRVTVSDLKAGESQTLPAGHFYEGACELVGIYADGAPQDVNGS